MAKHRRMFWCSSDSISVFSSTNASSWKCASRRFTATGRPSKTPSKTTVPHEPYPKTPGPTLRRPTLISPRRCVSVFGSGLSFSLLTGAFCFTTAASAIVSIVSIVSIPGWSTERVTGSFSFASPAVAPPPPRFLPRAPRFFLPASSLDGSLASPFGDSSLLDGVSSASFVCVSLASLFGAPTVSAKTGSEKARVATTIAAPTPRPKIKVSIAVPFIFSACALSKSGLAPLGQSVPSVSPGRSALLSKESFLPSKYARPLVASADAAKCSGTHAQSCSVTERETTTSVPAVSAAPPFRNETNPSFILVPVFVVFPSGVLPEPCDPPPSSRPGSA
mmetsp:Transcript_10876/g.40260  ORF Transcript_10876/g.40260 Transcript_10876/m.40260 type:complete len:334 (-) Transcript_10876:1074-2075(-)